MRGAFPLPDRTGKFLSTMVTTKPKWVTAGTTVRDAITFAGQQLRDGAWTQSKLGDLIDEYLSSNQFLPLNQIQLKHKQKDSKY